MANRITQVAVEAICPVPVVPHGSRVTQIAVEALGTVGTAVAAVSVDLTQVVLESIQLHLPQISLTQEALEYIQSPTNKVDMTQEVLEVVIMRIQGNNYIAMGNSLIYSGRFIV